MLESGDQLFHSYIFQVGLDILNSEYSASSQMPVSMRPYGLHVLRVAIEISLGGPDGKQRGSPYGVHYLALEMGPMV